MKCGYVDGKYKHFMNANNKKIQNSSQNPKVLAFGFTAKR
jgi:hypothetical protein